MVAAASAFATNDSAAACRTRHRVGTRGPPRAEVSRTSAGRPLWHLVSTVLLLRAKRRRRVAASSIFVHRVKCGEGPADGTSSWLVPRTRWDRPDTPVCPHPMLEPGSSKTFFAPAGHRSVFTAWSDPHANRSQWLGKNISSRSPTCCKALVALVGTRCQNCTYFASTRGLTLKK